jgi:hypothetical protein
VSLVILEHTEKALSAIALTGDLLCSQVWVEHSTRYMADFLGFQNMLGTCL